MTRALESPADRPRLEAGRSQGVTQPVRMHSANPRRVGKDPKTSRFAIHGSTCSRQNSVLRLCRSMDRTFFKPGVQGPNRRLAQQHNAFFRPSSPSMPAGLGFGPGRNPALHWPNARAYNTSNKATSRTGMLPSAPPQHHHFLGGRHPRQPLWPRDQACRGSFDSRPSAR